MVRRLLAICSSGAWGGTETWILRAAEHLAASGWTVRLAVRNVPLFAGRLRGGLSPERFTLVPVPLRNDGDLGSVLTLSRLARASDVVLATRVRDYWLGGLAARLAGRPLVLRLGVVRPMRPRHFMDRMRYGHLPSAILVNAQRIADVLRQTPWLSHAPIHVVYNGVDAPGPLSPSNRAAARARIGADPADLLIVGAGRLANEKRWAWFIDAVARLVESGQRIDARLLGEGAERADLEARIRSANLGGAFRLEGARTDAAEWIAAADLLVLPSRNEGIANVVLEAMGRGVPVVATAAGGIAEIARDAEHALLAPVDGFDAFAERVERAASSPELRRTLGEAGLALVRGTMTWQAMTSRLEKILLGVGAR